MPTFAYYLLKVSVCSGLLYGYYFFILRNKRFHQYNRFYLLSAVVLSFIIPLIKIKFWNETVHEMPAIELLKVAATRDAFAEKSFELWDFNSLAAVFFSIVSAAFFIWLLMGAVRIVVLIKSNPCKIWNNINFIFTEAKGTPFSFFKYIFWNKNIDLQTQEGNLILQHELAHVLEKHSADKLFMHIALIIGWPNPFFWLIRKELNMIHEFIADEKAINDGDTSSFSAMLLKTVYPQHSFTALENSFFHSPIKRRLIMFTTSKKPRYSYLRRLMILPLLGFVVVFFSFKTKGQTLPDPKNNSTKPVTGTVRITNEISMQQRSSKYLQQGSTVRITNGHIDTTIKVEVAPEGVTAITNGHINTKSDNHDTSAASKALVVLDGVQMSWKEFQRKDIAPEKIQSMTVLKGKGTTYKYGEKGADGVIEIITKFVVGENRKETPQDSAKPAFSRVFTVVENPPYYAKGMTAFANYIQTDMQYPKEAIANKKEGAVSIQFIIDENGKLSDFKKVSAVGSGLEEEAIRLLKNSSDWKPGIQNGHKVPVQIVQQIIFNLPGKSV